MQRTYRNLFLICAVVAVASFAMGLYARKYSSGHRAGRSMWLASLTGRGMSRSPSQTFAAVLDNLEDSYVDKIQDEKVLTYGALRQMMDELDDPNSRFLDPAETQDVLDAEDGVFHGIGAVVNIESTHFKLGEHRRAVVANVLPGGPASKAGLRVGDAIVMIGNQWIYGPHLKLKVVRRSDKSAQPAPTPPQNEDAVLFKTQDIMQRLSRDGQSVRLTLMGGGGKSLEVVDVAAAATRIPAVEVASRDAAVAEVRISGLTKSVGRELDSALERATESGAKRIVLDLRGCVGGSLERATQMASRFTDGALGSIDRKVGAKTGKVSLVAHKTRNSWAGPLVVMVDHSTLGAAEFLAGSLAAKGRATVVGTRTFGDGLEHSVLVLHDGSSLLMTTGKIYTSNGQSFQARGVTPAVTVASAAEQSAAAMKAFR